MNFRRSQDMDIKYIKLRKKGKKQKITKKNEKMIFGNRLSPCGENGTPFDIMAKDDTKSNHWLNR